MNRESPEDPVHKLRRVTAEKASELPPRSPGRQTLQKLLDLTDAELVNQIFSLAHPNPDRTGCPPREVLVELTRGKRPLTDAWWQHVTQCSPCHVESMAIATSLRAERTRERRRWAAGLAAAAAVALVVFMGLRFFSTGRVRERQAVVPRPSSELRAAAVDLRPFTIARSDAGNAAREPVSLPRARVRLTMLLPAGSEPGGYDVQVVDSELRPQSATAGEARLENYMTTLEAVIDLQSLPPGLYRLAVRRRGDGWQLFPARVR